MGTGDALRSISIPPPARVILPKANIYVNNIAIHQFGLDRERYSEVNFNVIIYMMIINVNLHWSEGGK